MTEDQAKYEVPVTIQRVAMANFDEYAMTADKLLKQVQLIQEVMAKVMKVDEHYGIIPGTKKPSLYQAGAEKLGLTFRLSPKYQITHTDLSGGHREYEVVCTLTHIPTGQIIGQGVGSCSTMEGKYRFRTGEVESTGTPVPKEYWTERDQNLIGGKGFSTKKIDGKLEIVQAGPKVEHDNPADYYNTALKMAKKRAHVDSIKTATACSDIFTQDLEDMPEVIDVTPEKTEPVKTPFKDPPAGIRKPDPAKFMKPPEKTGEQAQPEPLTDPQLKKIRAMIGDHDEISSDDKKACYDWLKTNKAKTVEWKGKPTITKESASDIIENFTTYFAEWIESVLSKSQDEAHPGEDDPPEEGPVE